MKHVSLITSLLGNGVLQWISSIESPISRATALSSHLSCICCARDKLAEFVERGGAWGATYQARYLNGSDLCFMGRFPRPLRKILGFWVEEFDALPQFRYCSVIPMKECTGLTGIYKAGPYADLLHMKGAEVLAT